MKKIFIQSIAEDLVIILLGSLLVFLNITHQLTFYINKTYFTPTLLAGLVLGLAGVIKLIVDMRQRESVSHDHDQMQTTGWVLVLLLLVIIGGFILPRKPLTATTATKRTGSDVFIPTTGSGSTSAAGALKKNVDTKKYTLADWIRILALDPEPEHYRNKAVSVEGFVQSGTGGTFKVTRFVITCCVVDATPVSLIVNKPMGELQSDQWIRVSGKFDVKTIGDDRELVIDPQTVEKIAVPDNPYL